MRSSPFGAGSSRTSASSSASATVAVTPIAIATRRVDHPAGGAAGASASIMRCTLGARAGGRRARTPGSATRACAANDGAVCVLAVLGHVEVGELLGEAGVATAAADLLQRGDVLVEGGAEAAQAVAVAEAELGGDLVLVEQADVVDRPRQRLGGLDLDAPVALQARRRRDQLPDDDVLLQPVEAVDLALQRGVGEDLRRLLEGRRRQERVRVQRGLRDAEDDLLELGLLAAGRPDPLVLLGELVAVHELPGQVGRVALLVHADLLEHLADDQLDVLVVDVDALRLVDLLHLLDEVLLGLRAAAELQQVVRVQRALVELRARLDALALVDPQARAPR